MTKPKPKAAITLHDLQVRVTNDGGLLGDLATEVHQWCVRKEWRGPKADPRSIGDEIALLHSELSEALEAYRRWGMEPMLKFETGPDGRDGYAYQKPGDPNAARWIDSGVVPKPEGVASEYADTFIRLLDNCAEHGIDLFAEYRAKMDYNESREIRHGGKRM